MNHNLKPKLTLKINLDYNLKNKSSQDWAKCLHWVLVNKFKFLILTEIDKCTNKSKHTDREKQDMTTPSVDLED